jgi:hypothetical protein
MEKEKIHGRGHFFVKDLLNEEWPAIQNSAGEPISSGIADLAKKLKPISARPYVKNPAGSEDAWALKEATAKLKAAVDGGDEAKALELFDKIKADTVEFMEKISAFTIRMT